MSVLHNLIVTLAEFRTLKKVLGSNIYVIVSKTKQCFFSCCDVQLIRYETIFARDKMVSHQGSSVLSECFNIGVF
jgi:hypothetical protein